MDQNQAYQNLVDEFKQLASDPEDEGTLVDINDVLWKLASPYNRPPYIGDSNA